MDIDARVVGVFFYFSIGGKLLSLHHGAEFIRLIDFNLLLGLLTFKIEPA